MATITKVPINATTAIRVTIARRKGVSVGCIRVP